MKTLPNWPAVLNVNEAKAFCGLDLILYKMIIRGYVEPYSKGHRATTFLTIELEAGLTILKNQGGPDAVELPAKIRSVENAVEFARKLAA